MVGCGVPPARSVASSPAASSALGRRALWRGAWVLVFALLLPGLMVGPVFDDWFHAADAHAETSWATRLFSLYDFFAADEVAVGRRHGLLPWWADDALSIRFFRPLSSLLLSIDHQLLDGGGVWSHLHAALWFALTLYAAHRVFSLLFDVADARWITPLYGILSCHTVPLALAAARHSHVSAALALASFECLIRALRTSRLELHFAAGALFTLALLGGESAVAVLPIAFVYAMQEAGVRRALRLLAPEIAIAFVLSLGYALGGFGVQRSSGYLTPGSAEFFVALPARLVSLAGGLLSGFPLDLWLYGAEPLLVGVGVAALAVSALALRAIMPLLDAVTKRRLLGLLAGAFIALVPLTAGIPGGRLLIIPCIASAALFAISGRRAAHTFRVQRLRALFVMAWVFLFGIGLNPLFRVLPPLDMARTGRELPMMARSIAEHCAGKAALAVGAPDSNVAYLPVLLMFGPEPRPSVFHILSMAPGEHRLKQTQPGSFELRVSGDFMGIPWARIYRDTPIPAGTSRALEGLDVQVLETSESAMTLSLNPSAEGCWLTLERGQLVPLPVPAVGEVTSWTPTPRPI